MTAMHSTQDTVRRILSIVALIVSIGIGISFTAGSERLATAASLRPTVHVLCVAPDQRATGQPCFNPNAFPDIPTAILNSGAGDEIRLMVGTYTGGVNIDRPLIISGGYDGSITGWGVQAASCIGQPGFCSTIDGVVTMAGGFEVTFNGMTLNRSVINTNGGTVRAFGNGIRLGANAGNYSIMGTWNIAAPGFIEIVNSRWIAEAGAQIVGDGWLNLYEDGTLSVADNLTVGRINQRWGGTRCGHVEGSGTLNVSVQYTWQCGEMRGTGVTNLLSSAVMAVTHDAPSAPGVINQRTFNNQGVVNWDQGNPLALDAGATFNNSGTFDLMESYNFVIGSNTSAGTFNNSGLLRSNGALYRQVLKANNNVVFNNTGIINVPDASGTLHFLQGTFNLLNGSNLTGPGVAQVGDQTGIWNVAGTVQARNVTLIRANSCGTCSGITGAGTLNISGHFDWAAGVMQGSGVTDLLAGATGTIYQYATLSARTFSNHGTIAFASNGNLTFSGSAAFDNYGSFAANDESNSLSVESSGQTGTFTNRSSGIFTKSANHNFRVNGGVTFVNTGQLNISGPGGEVRMEGGQFRQTSGITSIDAGAGLQSGALNLLLEGGTVRGTGAVSCAGAATATNTGTNISPGAAAGAVGTLTVNCPYAQSGSGRLTIEIGGANPGTGHDTLAVNGPATLGGTLLASVINGYTPPAGSQFTVILCNPCSGSFAAVQGPFTATYNQNNVTITYTPGACTPGQFSDVPPGHTFYPYIFCLVNRGIISGYSDCTFRPNNNVTRGQIAKIVANAAGYIDPQTAQMFQDVPPGSTFFDYVGRLASRSIMSGYPCGGQGEPCGVGNLPYFRPNNNATRAQISKIVSNTAGFTEPPGAQRFEDVAPGSTFFDYIQRLASRSIMNGYPCGGPGEPCGSQNLPYFRPNSNATRGQTSKIVANTFFPECATR